MLKFRTISQALRIWVLPEIEKRILSGQIRREELPYQLSMFRVIQRIGEGGNTTTIVELNEEAHIIVNVTVRRQVKKGELITLNDIYPERCHIKPPLYNGRPESYFIMQSFFFDFSIYFNFRPNMPGIESKDTIENYVSFPAEDFANTNYFLREVNPIHKMKMLIGNGWPPAPGYYPNTLYAMHTSPNKINEDAFTEVVSDSYNPDFWKNRIEFWKETDFFPGRYHYLEKAINSHLQSDYISAIYIILPQFEGIIYDYLKQCSLNPSVSNFRGNLEKLKTTVLGRRVLLFPKDLVAVIFDYLKNGPFWTNTENIISPTSQINRHGISHGIFKGFESKLLSLKFLILLDALAYLLLHDRITEGTI